MDKLNPGSDKGPRRLNAVKCALLNSTLLIGSLHINGLH